MPNGKQLQIEPSDWLGLYKWIYQHIDGPPKASDGESDKILKVIVEYADGESNSSEAA